MSLIHKIAVIDDEKLAKELGLDLVDYSAADNFDFLLIRTKNHLELRQKANSSSVLVIDFLEKSLVHRKKHASLNNEAIARAVGLKTNKNLNIIDATAGLGKDAFILASLGANITLLERSSIIAALLEDALTRAKDKVNMTLVKEDAITFLNNCSLKNQPDVIYLDPMFPPKIKSALVKKDIKMLQTLLGTDQDEDKLLIAALDCAKSRVVLKRPNWAKLPTAHKPHMNIYTPNYYFAVYIKHNQ